MPFSPIPAVIAAIARGEMVILVDDENRENEGDLVMAAQFADARAIAFMATRGCGLICLATEGAMLDRLGLATMTSANGSRFGTAFTLSIEAREGVTTGISAGDRARTIQAAIAADAKPEDVVTPGHVFPLRARDGGVLVRAGQTEGSVDLARLARLRPAAVICEIMKPDGEMARLPDLEAFAGEHGLLLASIADLIAWRESSECTIDLVAEAGVPTPAGEFRGCCYRSRITGEHHLALVHGPRLRPGAVVDDPVLVRVQKELLLSDLFGVPGGLAPVNALRQIAETGDGVFLSMRDTDGSGLPAHLVRLGGTQHLPGRAVEAVMDPRDYGTGAQILHHLGVRRMRLITAGDRHIAGITGHGLEVVERVRPA